MTGSSLTELGYYVDAIFDLYDCSVHEADRGSRYYFWDIIRRGRGRPIGPRLL